MSQCLFIYLTVWNIRCTAIVPASVSSKAPVVFSDIIRMSATRKPSNTVFPVVGCRSTGAAVLPITTPYVAAIDYIITVFGRTDPFAAVVPGKREVRSPAPTVVVAMATTAVSIAARTHTGSVVPAVIPGEQHQRHEHCQYGRQTV